MRNTTLFELSACLIEKASTGRDVFGTDYLAQLVKSPCRIGKDNRYKDHCGDGHEPEREVTAGTIPYREAVVGFDAAGHEEWEQRDSGCGYSARDHAPAGSKGPRIFVAGK